MLNLLLYRFTDDYTHHDNATSSRRNDDEELRHVTERFVCRMLSMAAYKSLGDDTTTKTGADRRATRDDLAGDGPSTT